MPSGHSAFIHAKQSGVPELEQHTHAHLAAPLVLVTYPLELRNNHQSRAR